MSGLIPQHFLDALLERTSIVEVISSRISLKRTGNTYKACCPFHKEKTPSFHVTPDKNFYHCFGCGASGDAISFIREFDNLSFNEAVEDLAKIAGMEIPRNAQELKQLQQVRITQDALELAADHYERQLGSHPLSGHAREYLQKRGLNQEVISRYRLGFAPPDRNNLAPICNPEQYQALVEAKLISTNDGRPYDLLQNRIVFPIRNPRGKTVGFGGRTLGNDKAKYINSPESPVFHKSHEIYGLYEAYQQQRQLKQLLVVEGYMDVVALAQFGIHYAVATLGTATNQDNLSTLLKHCKQLIFCFDGDAAGFNAAVKAMRNSLPLMQDGMELRFLVLPPGEDPDTLIRKEGREKFDHRVNNAKALSTFFFEVHSTGLDLSIAEHKGHLKERASADLAQIASPTIRSAMKARLYELTNAWAARNQTDWKRTRHAGFAPPPQASEDILPIQRQGVQCLCLALYYQPDKAEDYLAQLTHLNSGEFATAQGFARFLRDNRINTTGELLSHLARHSEPRKTFYTLFDGMEHIPAAHAAVAEASELLQRQIQEHRKNTLIDKQVQGTLTNAEKEELKMLSN